MGENILTALSSLLTAAPTTAVPLLNIIGQHMQGNAATNQSLTTLLTQMASNPSAAATYSALIAALPNVPQSVIVEIEGAVAVASNPVAYAQAMTRAQAALTAANSTSALGGILAGLSLPAV